MNIDVFGEPPEVIAMKNPRIVNRERMLTADEINRAPELLREIKKILRAGGGQIRIALPVKGLSGKLDFVFEGLIKPGVGTYGIEVATGEGFYLQGMKPGCYLDLSATYIVVCYPDALG